MREMPDTVQRNYRKTMLTTLTELWHSTESLDFHKLIDAYWAHVQQEVPQIEQERVQQTRTDLHRVWRNVNTGAPGRGFR
jgi:hypothetical protein